MFRKFLILFLLYFISFLTVSAEGVFKISSIALDTSNSIILMSSNTSPVPAEIKSIKINTLENPKRFYFDINSSILTDKAQSWFFNSADIKQVKISQFTPSIVRVVLYTSDNFDKSKIVLLKRDKSLILQFKDEICQKDYFENIYTDEKISSGKFYENLSISNVDIDKLNSAQHEINKDKMSQVQDAFSSPSVQTNIIKDLKLKTNYYISSVSMKGDSILLNGFGDVTLEKPMYLLNPIRIVYDITNSITNYNIRNKTYTSKGNLIKVAQFDSSRSRLVITPASVGVDYVPVFSPDGQSVLFMKAGTEENTKIFDKSNNMNGVYLNKNNELILSFDSQVIHSVKRNSDNLVLKFYNTYSFNQKEFQNVISKTVFQNTQATLMPKMGLTLEIPLTKSAIVKTYMGADGKAVKILLKNMSVPVETHIQKTDSNKKQLKKEKIKQKFDKEFSKKLVVIDAGHGGSDYGAIREGVNEKDINLDVANLVVKYLAQAGVPTMMTRTDDEFISLQDRVTFSTDNNADLFVSVHVNASVKPEINGLETHYYNDNSLSFANVVHSNLINSLNKKDRGVFKSKFYVINHNKIPAILVEIGFISNKDERNELITKTRKENTARAIADGIIKYLREY